MASRAGAITKWLVDWLNDPAREWPAIETAGWTAVRSWEPELKIEDARESITVQVSADARMPNESANRAKLQRDLPVYIDFRQKYGLTGPIPDLWLDDRVSLVESIDDALHLLTFSGQPTGHTVYVQTSVIDPLCDRFDLDEFRQFSATIEVTVRELKPR